MPELTRAHIVDCMHTVTRQRRTPPAGLGEALRQARDEAGLSQGAVAAAVGVRPDYISKLERGERCPSVKVAQALASVLELRAAGSALLSAAAVDDAGRSHPWRTRQQ
ncbi:helix-turn-helix transcriptional regulator [Streptomyces sp. NPDC006372]|uniref:helix-turn-helix transcriptional regulator n=1 Tax=Streptomyces sp. NPDC006372 TaxID=3155599 RepID=UPI0033B791B5